MTSVSRSKPKSFFDLPGEVRNHVYKHLLRISGPLRVWIGLFNSCRKARLEFRPLLFKYNTPIVEFARLESFLRLFLSNPDPTVFHNIAVSCLYRTARIELKWIVSYLQKHRGFHIRCFDNENIDPGWTGDHPELPHVVDLDYVYFFDWMLPSLAQTDLSKFESMTLRPYLFSVEVVLKSNVVEEEADDRSWEHKFGLSNFTKSAKRSPFHVELLVRSETDMYSYEILWLCKASSYRRRRR